MCGRFYHQFARYAHLKASSINEYCSSHGISKRGKKLRCAIEKYNDIRIIGEYCYDTQNCHLARLERRWKCCQCDLGPNTTLNCDWTTLCDHEVCHTCTKLTVGN